MRNNIVHILHVDDDEEDRWIFQDGLQQSHPAIKLTQFEDGIHLLKYMEAISLEHATGFAIVCDMQMPVIGGLDVLGLIKQMPGWSETPFIIFSTSSLKEDICRCLKNGALAFYSKPCTFPESQQIINEMVQCCQQNRNPANAPFTS